MMKTGLGKRDSIISWNPPASSRFSVSTQGSGNRRISTMSTRTSIYGGISPTTPTGDSIPFPEDRGGSSRASVISGLSDTDETIEEPDGPSPKVSISLEDGREFDLDTVESDTLVDSFRTSDIGLLPPVKFPSETLSESIGDGFEGDDGSGAMTFSTASKRMSMITELRSKKDLSDAVSLLTVDEITAEVENKHNGLDEEYEEYEEEEDEDEYEDESEEEDEDGDEVELELHDADEPGKPITSHAGSSFHSYLFFAVWALSILLPLR